MAKSLILLAGLVTALNAAPVEEKFLPFMSSDSTVAATAGDAAAATGVNASPVIVSSGSAGKKVQITISKEVTAGHHGGAGAGVHAHAAHHAHAGHEAARPAQLHLVNGPVLVDNETVTGVLQNLLAGNIQNVQAHGQPLAVPPGGKPVAVIFSSAMHVVDIGDLQPPKVARHGHNHTHHAGINHTSILQSLMSPLLSLTHMGAQTQAQAPVATAFAQPMQMQPIVVMMPMAQQLQQLPGSIDPSAQLGGVLQGILSAKQQILENVMAAHPGHAAAAAPAVALQSAPSVAVQAAAAPAAAVQAAATPVVAVQAAAAPAATVQAAAAPAATFQAAAAPAVTVQAAAAPAATVQAAAAPAVTAQAAAAPVATASISAGVPVVGVPQLKKTKKIDISITKTT